MIEVNIRIVETGTELELLTRCAKIQTPAILAKMREKVCNEFAKLGLAAVYCSRREQILVLTEVPISPLVLKEEQENSIVEVEDGGDQILRSSSSKNDARLLAQLIERQIRIKIKHRLKLHTVDSPRIFQENTPFKTAEGIDACRRYEVSAIPIEGVGVGISVDISTAFFTCKTVADFFRGDIPDDEQRHLREVFESLSQRQQGQKGTLLYDLGNNKMKCYFGDFRSDLTCATTGRRIVNGEVYDSLLKYYEQKQPQLRIDADDSVAWVSFYNISGLQPVAAKSLRLRVMNDALPKSLKQVDKIAPEDRVRLINDFWLRLGNDILGTRKLRVSRKFWQPEDNKTIKLLPPALQFNNGHALPKPQRRGYVEFQEHYRQRFRFLHKVGCLDVPIPIKTIVHFAVPAKVSEEMRGTLIKDLIDNLSRLTKKPILSEIVLYEDLDDVFSRFNLHYTNSGIVVFVFEDDAPESYYKVDYKLSDWRVKRITFRELTNKFSKLMSTSNNGNGELSKAERNWRSFMDMISLDVIQQMDCVPWGFKDDPPYDAHLVIDVGRDERHFALSLLTFRPSLASVLL